MEFERAVVSARVTTHYAHAKKVVSLGWGAGGLLASGGADARVRVWTFDGAGGAPRVDALAGHEGVVDALAWAPDAAPALLATGATDRTLRIWDTRAGGRAAIAVATPGQALTVAWDGPARLAVGTRDDALVLVDARRAGDAAGAGAGAAAAPDAAVVFATHLRDELNDFAFARDGLLYCGLGSVGVTDEGALGVFDVSGGAAVERARVRAHSSPITHVKFSPSGESLLTAAGDAVVCLWDPLALAVLRVFDRAEAAIRAVSWTRGGAHAAVASGDREESARTLEVLRVADGTRVCAPAAGSGGAPPAHDAPPTLVRHAAWARHADLLAFSVEDAPPPPSGRPSAAAPGGAAYEAGAVKILAALRRA